MTNVPAQFAGLVAESAKIQPMLPQPYKRARSFLTEGRQLQLAVHGLFIVACVCVAASSTNAQEQNAEGSIPIYQREPYDLITLKKDDQGEGGETFRVRPLDLPGRQVPDKQPPGAKLRVEVWHDGQFKEAELAWRTVEKVELFEQLVLTAAESLVAQREFEQAFDYYDFLQSNYPQTPGLAASQRNYIYRSAGVLYQQRRYVESLALLSEVFSQDADHPGIGKAIADVTNQLLIEYEKAGRYSDARDLIQSTSQRNSAESKSMAAVWATRLQQSAIEQAEQARAALNADKFRRAHQAAAHAIDIWPKSSEAQHAYVAAQQRYPIVRVGVGSIHATNRFAAAQDRVQLRRRRLLERPLVEMDGFATTGGRYVSPLGEVEVASDLRSLTFSVVDRSAIHVSDRGAISDFVPNSNVRRPTGYDISHRLWQAAGDKSGGSLWDSLLESVDVDDVYQVRVELQRPHVSPLAVLARLSSPPEGAASALWLGKYELDKGDAAPQGASLLRFVQRGASGGPREIVESLVSDPQQALSDLQAARLDVLERVDPAEVAALAADDATRIGRYAVPSVHFLLPNTARPFPANRPFRRALAYAIARDQILSRDILAGVNSPGSQVISAPLPAAYAAGQAWGYGYDESIQPLPYEPRMGLTLMRVAADELTRAADKAGREPPEFMEIVIGHGDDWLHRRACSAIAQRLGRIGIPCRCLLLSAAGDEAEQCDFVYTERLMTEPAVDVPLWLAAGDVDQTSDYLSLSVRELTTATNWRQVRQRLQKVHAAFHAEQTVIPLWQLVDFFAYRADVAGLGDAPVGLYQDVQRWKITTPVAEASSLRPRRLEAAATE